MLYTRSHGQTTQVYSKTAFPFEYNRLRRVIVQPGINQTIGTGGVGRNLVVFDITWHQDRTETSEKLKGREDVQSYEENPRLAQPVDDSANSLIDA